MLGVKIVGNTDYAIKFIIKIISITRMKMISCTHYTDKNTF